MLLEQKASPGAIRNIEELARMEAQYRPEPEPPVIVKAPTTKSDESLTGEAAATGKGKILLKVQNKAENSQSIRIYTVSIFEPMVYSNKETRIVFARCLKQYSFTLVSKPNSIFFFFWLVHYFHLDPTLTRSCWVPTIFL